jgi:curved DNA-binding protein CbpA
VRNFYKVLGVRPTADDERVKSAFRRRAMAVHPDLNPGGRRSEARFQELMEAYEVLRDAKARADYDTYLVQRRTAARRRFMHSAAVMAMTFALTMTAGFSAMALQGMGVHSQTWQLAAAWLTSVEIEAPLPIARSTERIAKTPGEAPAKGAPSASAMVASSATIGDTQQSTTGLPPARASSHVASSTRSHKAETAAKAPSRAVAVAPTVGVTHEASNSEGWSPWPAAGDRPYYGLGASDLQ